MSGRTKVARKIFDPSSSPRGKKSLTENERAQRLSAEIARLKARNAMAVANIDDMNRQIQEIQQMLSYSHPVPQNFRMIDPNDTDDLWGPKGHFPQINDQMGKKKGKKISRRRAVSRKVVRKSKAKKGKKKSMNRK